uniref:Uncharacterized protein n=1 Tax=Anguilla anguilla TaxID=7936 RepID=A0A0E9QJF1_ANGAN
MCVCFLSRFPSSCRTHA